MLNHFALMGYMHKEPSQDVDYGGHPMIRFRLAVQRDHARGNQKYDFISCSAVGRVAELILKYVKKDQCIIVEGRISSGLKNVGNRNIITEWHNVDRVYFDRLNVPAGELDEYQDVLISRDGFDDTGLFPDGDEE